MRSSPTITGKERATDMFPEYIRLTGVKYGARQENIKKYAGHGVGNYTLVREPDNEYDPNAIKVAFLGHYEFGYVPTRLAQELAPQMDSGRCFEAEFISRNESPYHDTVGLTIRIIEVC